MPYFSAHEIEVARAHRYNDRDESIAVKLFYRRFWDFLIQFVPMWIAPNAITLIGFLLEVIAFVLSFIYSDGLRRLIPSWVSIVNGVFVFAYQTLDNLELPVRRA